MRWREDGGSPPRPDPPELGASFPYSSAGDRELQWAAASTGSASSRGGGGEGRELQEGWRGSWAARSGGGLACARSHRGRPRVVERGWRMRCGWRGASVGGLCASCASAVEENGEAEEDVDFSHAPVAAGSIVALRSIEIRKSVLTQLTS